MPRTRSPFALTPCVRSLLIANAIVHLMRITVFTGPWFLDLFGLQPDRLLVRWWTPMTYMFVHAGFPHLAVNMLMLFFFGSAVEERMGSRAFGAYYAVCGLGGAVLSLAMVFSSPAGMVIGASGAILGVALAFAFYWPDAPIYVFPVPFPIKAKWLVTFFVVANLASALLGAQNGVAYLAHLGGLLFGFVYLKWESVTTRRERVTVPRIRRPQRPTPQAGRRDKPREKATAGAPRPDNEHSIYDEVDRVLDKISRSGLESLTPTERRLLDEMSRQLRRH
ncbi:MAG TPA: rhomboid family intramembrane serine protease [Gemmatimonadales bacterium]|jgi:membrane associated rhomboid family serine protease